MIKPPKSMIIGIHGPKYCGKSTIAKAYAEQYGAKRMRFADKLKNMLRVLGCTDAQVDGDEKEVPCALLCGRTPRYAMETLGTQWGRNLLGDTIWSGAALLAAEGKHVVFDDVRFPNEAEAIIRAGGLIIQLRRDGVDFTQAHESEHPLPAYLVHYIVANDSTPSDIAKQIAWLQTNRPT